MSFINLDLKFKVPRQVRSQHWSCTASHSDISVLRARRLRISFEYARFWIKICYLMVSIVQHLLVHTSPNALSDTSPSSFNRNESREFMWSCPSSIIWHQCEVWISGALNVALFWSFEGTRTYRALDTWLWKNGVDAQIEHANPNFTEH